MPFEVADGKLTDLREAPLATSRSKRILAQGAPLGEPVRTSEGWLYFEIGLSEDKKGWVLRDDCAEIPAPARPALNEAGFVIECVIADWKFGAAEALKPPVVSADYLIARAIIETDLANAGPSIPNSDGIGPLQVTSKEWQDYRDNAGALAAGARPNDWKIAALQIDAAAYRMYRDAQKMSALRHASPADPLVPSYLDLFFAYLTESPAAALAIQDARAINPDAGPPIDQVLKKPKGPLTEAEWTALSQTRPRFFMAGANPKSLGSVVTDTKKELDDALKKAFAKIQQHMPEAEPVIGQGGAPWFAIAEAEEQKNVNANDPGSKNTILDYFNATDHGRPNDIVPWCGAFAAHCMKMSGNATAAASIPTGAAGAANWKAWGDELPFQSTIIPKGAVVVLAPSSPTGGTGHVGFFVEVSSGGKSVTLLGGNQSQKVGRTNFPKEQIASVRWMEVATVPAGSANFNLPAALEPRKNVAEKIIAKFAEAGFGAHQQLAALANAIAESGLIPDAHNQGEDSVGLFQLRRILGVGGNHSVPALKDPDFNIELIIAEAKRYSSFAKAVSLEKAVDSFVRYIERPKETEAEVAKRIVMARQLSGIA